MKWKKVWTEGTGVHASWVLEGLPVMVTAELQGFTGDPKVWIWSCWVGDEFLTITGEMPESTVLTQLREKAYELLESLLRELIPNIPQEVEPAPVEVIPDSKGKLGYSDGWLRIRPDRNCPYCYSGTAKLDDGQVAHIHPFIRATKLHCDHIPGVQIGQYIAGIRWLDRK